MGQGRRQSQASSVPSIATEYCAHFEKVDLALGQAHDLRKLEIELYWKRATYFWTIIAVTFAGFFYSPRGADPSDVVIISCLGFLFSVGWYLVNRASSWAQRIWEIKLRLLEDGVMGPLHKTIIKDPHRTWRDLIGPRDYSISRVNVILSGAIALTWPLLTIKTLIEADSPLSYTSVIAIAGSLTVVVAMITLAQHRNIYIRDIDYLLVKYQRKHCPD